MNFRTSLLLLASFLAASWLPTTRAEDSAAGDDSSELASQVEFQPAFEGQVFERPIYLTHADDGSGRLYVMGQLGTIEMLESADDPEPTRVLDIRDKVNFDENKNEEGMLGIAFHPQYKTNREVYVYYTPDHGGEDAERRSVVSRFTAEKNSPQIDPESEEVVLTLDQPYWNHNGGTIVFGPDGMLYIGLGDGGLYGDPHNNGQDTQTLLGSILRIDVDRAEDGRNYAIPADNPFAGKPEQGRPEIWAYGLRNVWRMAFDEQTGELWAGDVGQDVWEEIDIIRGGGNYGWNVREGRHPYVPKQRGDDPPKSTQQSGAAEKDAGDGKFVEPVWEYHHDVGKSITGGAVYRGDDVSALEGLYIYADYISGAIYALDPGTGQRKPTNYVLRPKGLPVTSFGEGPQGELFVLQTDGVVYQVVAAEK